MSLHICVNGLKQSLRLCNSNRLNIRLTSRPGLLYGDKAKISHKDFSYLCLMKQSCDFNTASRPSLSQPGLGLTPQVFAPLSCREYSSASSSEKKGHLVYVGRIHKMFKTLKIFSLATSALGLSLQPYLWYSLQDVSLIATIPIFTAVNAFVFTNPFLIHFLSKRYINELYFNSQTKEFSATVLTFFARKETFTFTAADVKVPDIPGMFSMFTARDRPLFVDERDFTSMEVYKHLMGFDRPLDLRHVSNPTRQNSDVD